MKTLEQRIDRYRDTTIDIKDAKASLMANS